MNSRMYGNEYRTTVVCVDTYNDSIMRGRMFNPYYEGAKTFSSTMQFLTMMESMLDEMNFPQPFLETRTFGAKREISPENEPPGGEQRGAAATFAVKIIFRQNASWQGTVTWLEEEREESFRSVLELLLLMDSAISEAGNKKGSVSSE